MKSNLFFAIELSPEARSAVAAEAARWRTAAGEAARWYAAEDYHITLKFLGAREMCEIGAFAKQVGGLVASAWNSDELGGVPVEIAGAGAFPNLRSPRVLWAGIRGSSMLAELARRVDTACAALGVPGEEREYRPHVTLARVRVRENSAAAAELAPLESMFGDVPQFVAQRFALMQTSHPDRRKSGQRLRYNTVHTFDLSSSDLV